MQGCSNQYGRGGLATGVSLRALGSRMLPGALGQVFAGISRRRDSGRWPWELRVRSRRCRCQGRRENMPMGCRHPFTAGVRAVEEGPVGPAIEVGAGLAQVASACAIAEKRALPQIKCYPNSGMIDDN